jgi:hypothetical protein
MDQANRRQKLDLVWRIRKKISQIIKEYSYLPFFLLTLSLTGVGPSGPALTYMQIPLKVQKVSYRQKLGIPQAGSLACFKIKTGPI